MSRRSAEKKHKIHLGIRPRLFLSLAAMTLLCMVVQWVFQIRLLGYFYERERFDEIQELAVGLSSLVGDDALISQVQASAEEHSACIRVFCLEEGSAQDGQKEAVLVADAEANGQCMIHHMPSEQLSKIYDRVKENGGVYDRRMETRKSFKSDEDSFRVPGFHERGTSINAIHARLLVVDGKEYLMMLDTQLTPVDVVVKTLEVQFSWIMIGLLLAAFLVSLLTSRMVAKPLVAITQKAKGLAKGDYTPDFSGKGYREVQELADALNFAAAEIGATDRLQKELIANISHDLRTPLTMIKGYSEMMRDIPGENSPENVQAIIDETTRLSELVNDLMDLSKLQAGMQKLTPTVFDLSATVQDTMQRYETLISHQGYRIEVLSSCGETLVKADRTMILQVIYNLINNAVNYTGKSKRVTVTQTVCEGRVRLSIADDGNGIPPEQIPEIWDRYYRVDKVHNRAVIGTGLGLSIVKSILEAHGATYGVESAVGVGSVFWFELPLWSDKEE